MIYFMALDLWQAQLELHAYSYYASRQEFISRDSRFARWVMIVPERGEFQWEMVDRDGETVSGEAGYGDFVCARPKRPFVRGVTSSALSYHVLQWSFVDTHGEPVEVSLPSGGHAMRDTARLASTLEILKRTHLKRDDWSHRRQSHALEELLHLAWQTRAEPALVSDPLMRDAAALLEQRAGAAFSMREISEALGLGPVQFTRRFHAAYGRNPIEHVTALRLELAQRLLIDTALTLDEIAARCGWSSGAYLSNVFTKQLLTTPGKFRAARRV